MQCQGITSINNNKERTHRAKKREEENREKTQHVMLNERNNFAVDEITKILRMAQNEM